MVASPIAADDVLAELEDVMAGRLAKFGVVDARVRRDPASPPGTQNDSNTDDPDAGNVERGLLSLAAKFANSDKFEASIQFSDGQWLNFVTPVTPLQPVLSRASLPLHIGVAALVLLICVWLIRRLTSPYRLMEVAVKRIGSDLKSPWSPSAAAANTVRQRGRSIRCRPSCANMWRIASNWPRRSRMTCARR